MLRPHTPRNTTALIAASLAMAGTLTLPGCGKTWLASGNDKPAISPEDFIGEDATASANDTEPGTTATKNTGVEPVSSSPGDSDQPTDTQPLPDNADALAVNAMVGHINGEAVYADQIFNIDIETQLKNFGKRFEEEEFRKQAGSVIRDRLRGVIVSKLILGEAERNLKPKQHQAVDARIAAEREELLRFYGQGSLSKAKAEFRKDRGTELDDYLVTYREELLVGIYIRSKVEPKIVVTQRHIERWYEDNKTLFVQPTSRVIRILRVDDPAKLKTINQRLKRGDKFETVAADPELNSYNAEGKGLFMSGQPLPGKSIYGVTPVNDALLDLKEGQHTQAILAGKNYYFGQVVKLNPGKSIPLKDAQIKIRAILRNKQFDQHAYRFRVNVMNRGNFTDPEAMGKKLLEIAYARYDR